MMKTKNTPTPISANRTASGMLRFGLRVSSPSTAAASKPMNDSMPKTAASPTPEKPVGPRHGLK